MQRFVKWQDSQNSLLGDILIKYILNSMFKIKHKNIEIFRNNCGKPLLKNINNLHFNISHSGDWIVCIIDYKPVGIDIQKIKYIDSNIFKYCLSKDEYKNLLKKSYSERLSYFYDLWTLKESYIKFLGTGVSLSLQSFTINISANNNISVIENQIKKNCHFEQFNIHPQYKLSICTSTNNFQYPLNFVSLNTIIHWSYNSI